MLKKKITIMGNVESTDNSRTDLKAYHERRGSAMPIRLPIPDHNELERRFMKVLASMDLPPDKAKVLKSYDDEKKWDLVCDQERVHAKQPPTYYLNKLKMYLDPSASKSSKKRRMLGDSTSTQTLRDLEISLRTNSIDWVREFLNEDNNGLDVLVDYLSYTQVVMREQSLDSPEEELHTDGWGGKSGTVRSKTGSLGRKADRRIPRLKNSASKLNMGDATDDVHVCIMCLRAIMNHQYGFNLVFAHKQAINCIALSLNHRSLRTKALVLELLAAVCLVSGGHDITLSAFDNFKDVCEEKHRFETMMHYFKNFDDFHIDFMVACMQFINIVVHSVEDMNFRVHLQHEFTLIGLDAYLEKLRYTESDRLSVQVNAYLDNMIDVAILLEDSDTKTVALEKVQDLEEALSHANDRAREIEEESMSKIAELETHITEWVQESERLKEISQIQEEELLALRQSLTEKNSESQKRQSVLEQKLVELEHLKNNIKSGSSSSSSPTKVGGPAPPPPPPPPLAAPPPPPPPPPGRGPPAPPPPPGMGAPGMDAMTIKRKVQPKYRLPVLNWMAMKPNQVKGTVFADLDDERLYKIINFTEFEDLFKLDSLGMGADEMDGTPHSRRKQTMKPEAVSLMEKDRLRNVAITKRKIEISDEDVTRAINAIDLKTLSLERVEILLRITPNEKEIKAYKNYEKDKKPIGVLSDEDKFMISLLRVERLSQKLQIMCFIGNFFDTYQHLQPQLNAVIAASMSIKNSKKVRKMLEIILAFGNYMNSHKRGAVYGFKLQSLDMLLDTKAGDKKTSLLHFIVKTVKSRFPDLCNFDNELNFIEKASTVSIENIAVDLNDLSKGMDMTKKEYEARKNSPQVPVILQEFLANSEDKLQKLKTDARNGQEAYNKVVEYFGENPKTLAPSTFFSLFARFVKAFKQAEADLENWRKIELAHAASIREREQRRTKSKNMKNSQEAVMSELKNKQAARVRVDKKILNKDDVYHGALEDILLDLKNEPYRRADGVRRNQRRGQEMEM